jgi:pyrroloquinoline quinone (PQQ) biosynthesis protein C
MLLLRPSARIVQCEDRGVTIELDSDEVVLEGVAANLFRRMLQLLDGSTPLENVAAKLGEPVQRIESFAKRLQQAGVLSEAHTNGRGRDAPMSGRDFHSLHRRWATRWLRPVYEHSFWTKVTDGTATRAQVLGFAFEKYHYIEAAHEHMGLAAANATPEMMPHLARHFIEEYTHGDIYRKGLRSLFSDAAVVASQPLPSTRALVNFLNESAARNSFSYYAGNELLQLTENSGEGADDAVNAFYAAMRKHYPYTDKIVNSFIAHTHADQKLGHKDVFLEMCEAVGDLSAAAVNDALDVTRSMAEHLLLFMDGIDVHYERFPAVPRTRSGFATD